MLKNVSSVYLNSVLRASEKLELFHWYIMNIIKNRDTKNTKKIN